MQQLTSAQVRELRARAHGLNPVVSISEQGLSDNVLKEIDTSLKAHELIKVRVYGDSREERSNYLERICNELSAAPVQHIGKLLVIYRENAEKSAVDRKIPEKPKSATPRRSKRSYQG